MQSMQVHFEYAYHSFLQAYVSAAKFVDDFWMLYHMQTDIMWNFGEYYFWVGTLVASYIARQERPQLCERTHTPDNYDFKNFICNPILWES